VLYPFALTFISHQKMKKMFDIFTIKNKLMRKEKNHKMLKKSEEEGLFVYHMKNDNVKMWEIRGLATRRQELAQKRVC